MPPRPRRPGLRVVRREGHAALYVRGTVRGTRIFESTGTADPELAEEFRATREAKLYRSAVHETRPEVTFAAAVVSYLQARETSETTKINVGKLLKYFGPTITCDKIGQAEADKAGQAICRRGTKPQSIHRQVMTPLKAILQHAARRGWCTQPVFEVAKPGGRRTDWIRPAEAEAMVAAATDRFRPLLTFLLCTGARVNEAVGLDWADVDLQHGRAVLRATKNGDDRILDLPPRAMIALANIPLPKAARGQPKITTRSGAVFLNRFGQPYRRTNDTARGAEGGQIKRAFAAAVSGAGIERHLTPHHCRHTWASWHYALYRDPIRLREDGGWRTLSQVERYAKLTPPGMGTEIEAFLGTSTGMVPAIEARKASA